jgi:hypothetical protein
MGDFRSFKTAKRLPAKAMEPLVDPAGWTPESLKDVSSWSYQIGERDLDDLAAGIAAVRRRGVAIVDVCRENFTLQHLARSWPTCAANCWTAAVS